MTALDEKLFHLGINRFGFITEAKEHFRAAEELPLLHNAKHLFERHRQRARLIRRLAKRAIAAEVATQIRQRNKNLR